MIERVAQHNPAGVGISPKRRQPGHRHAVHLEGIRPGEPSRPEHRRADEHRDGVAENPNLDRGQRARIGAGEFEPDEGEQAQCRRPVPQTRRIPTDPSPVSGREQSANGSDRRDHPPDGADDHRHRHQSNPQQYVERPRQGVVTVLRSPDRRDRHPQRGSQGNRRQDSADHRGVDGVGHPLRQRTSGLGRIEPRRPPGDGDHGERDDQRPHATGQRVRQRDRQIGGAADPVREHRRLGHHGLTAMVTMVRFRSCSSTSTLPGTSTVNSNR